MKNRPAFRVKGLRRRWLLNTVGILSVLGLTCVIIVTGVFAAYYYSAVETDMRERAKDAETFLAVQPEQSRDEYYQSCIVYVQSFEEKNNIELQFIDVHGKVAASSHGSWTRYSSATPDVNNAIIKGVSEKYAGKASVTGERVMSVSSPLIYSDGNVVGVLRYATATRPMDMRIMRIACISLLVFVIVMAFVLISSHYYIRSILVPLGDIIDKAKKITNGSYGIQIQTKYDDEIGDLADTINEMSNQINQNEKIQAEFISSLSHELRTPLTAITGWSETLLSSEDLTEDTRRGMKIIRKEAGRLTEMVLELLEFTRIQDGRMTLHIEQVDIRAEFEDTIFMYGSRLAQDGIKLEYLDDDVEIPTMSCDPQRLRQVFLNILDNAAKHGSEGKRIEASITYTDGMVKVTIRDFGQGIPEDELPLVKKKFYKGSSKARGSGIGLAVCDEIVNLHGGSMTLCNAEGGGTLVTVQLPISQ